MQLKATSFWTEIQKCSIRCLSIWDWIATSHRNRLARRSRACSRMNSSIGAFISRIFQLSTAFRRRNPTINLHPNFSLVSSKFRHTQIRWTNIKTFGVDPQIDNHLGHTISITICHFLKAVWKTSTCSERAFRYRHRPSTWFRQLRPVCPCWIRIYRDSSGNTPSSKKNFTRISNCRSNLKGELRTRTPSLVRWLSRTWFST